MTLSEARSLLDAAPLGDSPSRINRQLTMTQAVDIVRRAIESPKAIWPDGSLDPIFEKRVLQVSQNRKRPQSHIGKEANE
jgi:hypothetical protein